MERAVPVGQTTVTITTSNSSQNAFVAPQEGWFQRNRRNKPQSNSVGTASLILTTGGMSIAWSLGYRVTLVGFDSYHLNASWFIGAMIGAFASMYITHRLPKKLIYLASGLFVLIGGIIFAATETYGAFVAARYLIGIGNGLIFVISMCYAGEESVKDLRGMLASTTETHSFNVGILIQVILSTSWSLSNNFSESTLFGILCILFSVLSIIFTFLFSIESPVYHILNNNQEGALDSVRRLVSPPEMTGERYEFLDDMNQYVAKCNAMSQSEELKAGLPGLGKLLVYRLLIVMTYSAPINNLFIISALLGTKGNLPWAAILYYALRWIGSLIFAITLDSLGRKKPMIFSSLLVCGMAFGIGNIFSNSFNIIDFSKMETAMILFFVFGFFSGMFSSASSAYLTEAFPLKLKPSMIGFTFIMEMLLLMLLLLVKINGFYEFAYALGAISLIFFLSSIFVFPETKKLNLIDALNMFQPLYTQPFQF